MSKKKINGVLKELKAEEEYLNGINEYDLIIKAPGISFKGIVNPGTDTKGEKTKDILQEFLHNSLFQLNLQRLAPEKPPYVQ